MGKIISGKGYSGRSLLLAWIFSWIAGIGQGQPSIGLYSPDSSLRLEIKVADRISCALYEKESLLLIIPSIDLWLNGGERMSEKAVVKKKAIRSVSSQLTVPIPYRRKEIADRYTQLVIRFKEPFALEFRLYDRGMAYRISTSFRDSLFVTNEEALFRVDPRSSLWFSHINQREGQDRFHTSFEGVYSKEEWNAIPDTMLTYAPVTVQLPDGHLLAISDANLIAYPGMFLQKSTGGLNAVFAGYPQEDTITGGEFPQSIVARRSDYIAKIPGAKNLPWRAVLVAKHDAELPANDLLYLLGEPSRIEDPSWIRYGKGTDEWITGINLFDVPFKAGINTASYKYYIDFANRFGFDQVMLDAGWSDYTDLFKVNPDLDMPALLAYAKQKGIRLMLWTLCSTLDRQLDSALTQFNRWGVESIMTDFMDRDDQQMVEFYHRIAKACADHHITVMFHGAYPPKGFNRTWPNVITHEGVLGSEWNIWSDLVSPEHDVAIAYTRMLAGPLDYEPGLLNNAAADQFRPISKNPMSPGTRCHQLAMFVTYDSPLQIFSGNISQGLREPVFMALLGAIPTTWDETKVLQGRIGEFIITARQKGNEWFVAGLNGKEERDIELSLDFLKPGRYNVTVCQDGVNANNYAADYLISQKRIDTGEKWVIHMANGGGFLVRLVSNKE